MQILPINTLISNKNHKKSDNNTVFGYGGKPVTLKYIVEKRSEFLPKRVLDEALRILAKDSNSKISLLEIHKNLYKPLLECKTIEEAKTLFKEFENIKPEVTFERNSRYAKEFKEKAGDNFVLKVLQEYWAKLRNKDDIAQDFGMKNRSSLEWALKQVDFVGYKHNYKTLVKASDTEGNKLIASKTKAWNAMHPDLMYAHNKKAAQGCKTEKYKTEQRQRILEYDKQHPERKEKIRTSTKETWEKCPEIKKAMSEFLASCPVYIKKTIAKKRSGQKLNEFEQKINNLFFKEFWEANPELKKVYAEARKKKI